MIKLWLKFVGILALIIVLVGGCGLVTGIVSLPFHAGQATIDTAHGVIDRTMNADNAIFSYEFYHDKYNDALMQATNISQTEKEMNQMKKDFGDNMSQWNSDQYNHYTLLSGNLDGYEQMYNKIVAEYNSNSHKLNHNIFKDHNLPYELPLNYEDLQ